MLNHPSGKIQKFLTIFIMAGASISCSILAKHGIPLSSSQILDSIQTYVDSTNTKTVVLIPMYHIAKSSVYDDLADYLETLKFQGYVTFCEGLLPTDKYSDSLSIPLYKDLHTLYSPDNPLKLDTLKRKMRKMLGHELGSIHDETASQHGMVVQTQSSLKQLTSDMDYWVDVTYADMIQEFEERFGEIELSQYDYDCPLESNEYKRKEDRRFTDLRVGSNKCNVKLGRWVLDPRFNKIAVVFGYSHISYLRWFVLKSNGYTLISNP